MPPRLVVYKFIVFGIRIGRDLNSEPWVFWIAQSVSEIIRYVKVVDL